MSTTSVALCISSPGLCREHRWLANLGPPKGQFSVCFYFPGNCIWWVTQHWNATLGFPGPAPCKCALAQVFQPASALPRVEQAQEADFPESPPGLPKPACGGRVPATCGTLSLSFSPRLGAACSCQGLKRRQGCRFLARIVTLFDRKRPWPLSPAGGLLSVRSGNRTPGEGLQDHPPLPVQGAQTRLRGGLAKACAGAPRNKGWSGLHTGVNKLWSENLTEPGDWGSGTPAGTDLPPRGQPGRREGSPTKLRRKVGREPMEVVAWALQGVSQGESVLAEMGSEVGLRRDHCWQTHSEVQAEMEWGALRRSLRPPQARESEVALVWDLSLQGAGLAGARLTQVGAVEWGCGGMGRGCEVKWGGVSIGHDSVALGTQTLGASGHRGIKGIGRFSALP